VELIGGEDEMEELGMWKLFLVLVEKFMLWFGENK
jgi:hypothetical protein